MTGEKIVYGGIRCYVKAKAAFIRKTMKQGLLKSPVLYGMNDEELEMAFDEVVMEDLLKKQNEMQPEFRMFLMPVFDMNRQEIQVESFCYLVNAVACNERCKQALLGITEPENARYYQAYRESVYCDSPFLYRFLQPQKKAARMAIGMLELVRREYQEAQTVEAASQPETASQPEFSEYHRFMNVLYAGYRPIKNMVKRLQKISGEDMRSFGNRDSDIITILSQTMAGLVIAQDLGIELEEDYLFYVMLRVFRFYESEWTQLPEKAEPTDETKESFRQIRKRYREPGSFHHCYYLNSEAEPEIRREKMIEDSRAGNTMVGTEAKSTCTELESLFLLYRLNLRMLAGIQLERSEVEQLLAVYGPMDEEEFDWVLLTATLCKYIASLHDAMEEEQTEELVYERDMAEQERARIAAELLQITLQAGAWESKWKEAECALNQKEQENEKLRGKLEQLEQRQQSEKEELTGLREYVYQLGNAGEPAWMVMEEGSYPACGSGVDGFVHGAPGTVSGEPETDTADTGMIVIPAELADEKVLVVGGHQKWQKKMRQMLPCGTFVASNHRNFDTTLLQNRKYIILNTDVLKHSIYYRIMAEKRAEQQVLYVHGCNMKRCFEELKQQIKQQE